jgi:hypothetical protein
LNLQAVRKKIAQAAMKEEAKLNKQEIKIVEDDSGRRSITRKRKDKSGPSK